jgi:deazaflavin-dependent oxidoreductase (nitroreductase family)
MSARSKSTPAASVDVPAPREVTAAASTRFGELPYGPTMTRLLEPMHGAFLSVNRWVALPVLRAGLGPVFSTPLTGSLMILRTTGRKSGARREIPLGYAIVDGNVYCIAGFGPETQWFKNILAHPAVEVVLPLGAISGTAEEVTDPAEWSRAFRVLMTSMGIVGRATSGDVRDVPEDRLREMGAGLPLVRIRPTGIGSGPADPGGLMWVPMQAASTLLTIWLGAKVVRLVGRLVRR